MQYCENGMVFSLDKVQKCINIKIIHLLHHLTMYFILKPCLSLSGSISGPSPFISYTLRSIFGLIKVTKESDLVTVSIDTTLVLSLSLFLYFYHNMVITCAVYRQLRHLEPSRNLPCMLGNVCKFCHDPICLSVNLSSAFAEFLLAIPKI